MQSIIVLGAGGHAKVLLDILKINDSKVLGVITPDNSNGNYFCGYPIIGNDDNVFDYAPESVFLVNGLGSIQAGNKRKVIFESFKKRGYSFATVIHPASIISSSAILLEGVQIMAGAIVQTGVAIGNNTIVNTKASIDHDCEIGSHVHIAPGATLSGSVTVGECSHIGTGATIIQGIKIGEYATVAAGGVVINDISDKVLVKGVPAK